MLDWACGWWCCWRASSVALLAFNEPLVATLFHYGAFRDSDVREVSLAWPAMASADRLVAIKVLAPASMPTRTPARR